MSDDHELEKMRSAALRNAQSVLAARQRAEEELLGAQAALRQASERMENMLESLSDGFCAVDRNWRITYINGRALQMIAPLDKSRAGLVGKNLWDEFDDLHGTSVAADCLRAMERRETVVRDFYYARLDCWLEMRLHPSPDGLTLYFQDITGRKLDQQALVENNTRLQVALAAGRLGDWRWDAAQNRVLLGGRAAAILGLPADTPLPWPVLRGRLHRAHRIGVRRAVMTAFRARTDLDVECRLVSADTAPGVEAGAGLARWVALVGRPDYHDLKGQETLVGMTGVVQDITDRKGAEDTLRDESHVLELLNDTGNILASTRDMRSLLRAATEAALGVSGAQFGAFLHVGQDGDATLFTLSTQGAGSAAQFDTLDGPRADALFGSTLRERGVLRVEDASAAAVRGTLDADVAAQFGLAPGYGAVRSYLAVPVVAPSGELLGAMFFGHPEAAVFTARSERIVSGIAAQAAIAVDNTRLYEATSRAAEERKVLLENEREARAEAERSSQMKDEFLATLSHELRTPLSAILGWSQVLRRGSRDGADLQRGLATIERNARAQAQLIEDLLDMSRITSGKVLLDMQVIHPSTFLDAAIETVRPAADAKHITIEKRYEGSPDVAGLLVAGDAGRLQQVVWNLLSNAIKFTPREGTVVVEVAARELDGNKVVAITVIDNGAGIRPEFITHVFERFRQEDASMTRRHGGLGLGLSIVKHLVEQHGGLVRAESPGEGLGSSFTIELPRAEAPPAGSRAGRNLATPAPAPEALEPAVRDLAGLTVLVVDDARDGRELIARILTDCNARVRIAGSAREAFDALRADRPDVLISDLGMPEVDGFELIGWVRGLSRELGGQVPAIALTAFARPEDRLKALEAGFSTHISKPVEPSELIATVASVVTPPAPMIAGDARGQGRNMGQ